MLNTSLLLTVNCPQKQIFLLLCSPARICDGGRGGGGGGGVDMTLMANHLKSSDCGKQMKKKKQENNDKTHLA